MLSQCSDCHACLMSHSEPPGVFVSLGSESQRLAKASKIPVFSLQYIASSHPTERALSFGLLPWDRIHSPEASQTGVDSNIPRGPAKDCMPHLICFVCTGDLGCQVGWGTGHHFLSKSDHSLTCKNISTVCNKITRWSSRGCSLLTKIHDSFRRSVSPC